MRNFDTESLRVITAFENITGSEVRDCIIADIIYFLVNPGKAALAIGKNGQTIKTAEKMIGKQIKILEFSEEEKQFIKNLVPQAQRIEINEKGAIVAINHKDRGVVIGRGGNKIKIIRTFLDRNSNIKELKIL